MYILSLICCFVKDQLMKFRKQENKKSIQGLFFRPGGNSTLIWGVCVGGGVYGGNLTRTCSSGGKDYVTTPV